MTTQDSSPPAPLSGGMMPATLSALRDLIAETDELQKAAGGSVTARALTRPGQTQSNPVKPSQSPPPRKPPFGCHTSPSFAAPR
ncbi:MAG: hypothetical protein NTW03_04290 [Verrucomicrobia bacterium]|nr:hypothetical protein [Verrucomicrobiota bacterium]